MAQVTVYNRDGSVYGTLDTDKYLFNNDAIKSEPTKWDTTLYPYVKINGVYYVNDGGEFSSSAKGNNSAVLLSTSNTYLWNNTSAPFDLFSFTPPAEIDSYRKVIGTEVEEIGGWKYDKVLMKNFRLNNEKYIGYYQLPNVTIRSKQKKDIGYKNSNDEKYYPATVAKYFNFGKIKILCTNFYDREMDNATITITNKGVTYSEQFYSADMYDFYLYYVPPLNLDPNIKIVCPNRSKVDKNIATVEKCKWVDVGTKFANIPEWTYSQVEYNLTPGKIELNDDETKIKKEKSDIILSYQLGHIYSLSKTIDSDLIWQNANWIRLDSSPLKQLFNTRSYILQYKLDRYINGWWTTDELIDAQKNSNRYLEDGSYKRAASTCFNLNIQLKNVPIFTTSVNHKFNLDSDSYEGKIINGRGWDGYNSNNIYWVNTNYGDEKQLTSKSPLIDFSTQTVFRCLKSLGFDMPNNDNFNPSMDYRINSNCHLYGSWYTYGEKNSNSNNHPYPYFSANSSIQGENVWSGNIMSVIAKNDTTTEGFYCLLYMLKDKNNYTEGETK